MDKTKHYGCKDCGMVSDKTKTLRPNGKFCAPECFEYVTGRAMDKTGKLIKIRKQAQDEDCTDTSFYGYITFDDVKFLLQTITAQEGELQEAMDLPFTKEDAKVYEAVLKHDKLQALLKEKDGEIERLKQEVYKEADKGLAEGIRAANLHIKNHDLQALIDKMREAAKPFIKCFEDVKQGKRGLNLSVIYNLGDDALEALKQSMGEADDN